MRVVDRDWVLTTHAYPFGAVKDITALILLGVSQISVSFWINGKSERLERRI